MNPVRYFWLLLSLPALAADVVAPNENLVADNVPPIPASIAAGVGRYTEFRAAGFSSWHPTRREMLISTRFADTSQVHRVSFPLGARYQLTFFRDSARNASFPPAGGDFFVFSKDAGGNEFAQVYRFDLSPADAFGRVTLLTDGASRNEFSGSWSHAGDRFAYTSTRRNKKDSDFYVVDPADPKSDRLLAQIDDTGWSPGDWTPDDRQLIAHQYRSINESYLWLMDRRSGEKKLLTPKEGDTNVAYTAARFSKDGRGLFITTDRGSEFTHLAYLDLATREQTNLTQNIPWDVEDIDLSDDGKLLAFVTNEDGLSRLHLLDTQTRKELHLPTPPAGMIASLSFHKNNRDLAFRLSSARTPSDVYSIDVASGKLDRWTESETAGMSTATFAEPQLIRWQSFDDKTICGFLYRPDPKKFPGPRPVIVNIHGGPESQFRPGFLASYNYYLNELGVALIFPNVRGSAGYGKTFLTLDNGFKRQDSVKDIGALFDWIQSQRDTLDASRVMVTGGSYGGFMTLAVATTYADRIRCAVDVVGISNFVSFLEHTEAYRRDLRRAEYGDERDPKMREFLTKISPLTNASRCTKPLFVVQGQNDPRVPRTEAEQMVAAVKKAGTPVWYLMAKDEGHGFAKKKNADFQFYATIAFVNEYLLK